MTFLIPAVASAVLLALTWPDRQRPFICLLWLLGALALQLGSGVYSPLWAVGLVPQALLALYLAIRFEID